MPVLFEHATLVMNGGDPRVQRRRPVASNIERAAKDLSRMPTSEVTRELFDRDGWRCRFCECRVVSPMARSAMRAALPGAIPWSKQEGYHGAFLALSASVDHVIPHSLGGTNDEQNLVTACWSCQFGRGAWSLEEVGLLDPRLRSPQKDEWDGLTRLLGSRVLPALAETVLALPNGATMLDDHDLPPPSPGPSRSSHVEWFEALDTIQSSPSSRLLKFVNDCTDLGVSWSLNKVLIVRMKVADITLEVLGVQQDGLVEIPWSISGKKEAFKEFTTILAAGIREAIVYETPKLWVVSKTGKQRLNLLELLEAAPTLRLALEALRSNLLAGP